MQFSISLKLKLIIVSITLGVIPVLIIGGFSIMKFDSFAKETILKSYKGLEDQAYANIQSGVRAELQQINPLIDRMIRLTKNLATSPNIPLFINAESRAIFVAKNDAEQIVRGLSETCKVQYGLVKEKVDLGLYSAEFIFQNVGRVYVTPTEMIEWNSVNQYSGEKQTAVLPILHVGIERIDKIYEYKDNFSPIVDDVQEMTGVNCSIFQKMNDHGDMLRIATNIQHSDGKRAIETYIPAVNPDGSPNEVVSMILQGETYRGITHEVDKRYIAIYKPIFNDSGTLLGAFFVGVPARSQALDDAISNARIGQLGYAFVLNSQGDIVIHPKSELIGKNTITDLGITEFREMLYKKDEDSVNMLFYHYQHQKQFVSYLYFPQRDWIICVNGVLDELFSEEINRSADILKKEIMNLYHSSKIKIGSAERYLFNQIRFVNIQGQEVIALRFGEYANDLEYHGRTRWFLQGIQIDKGAVFNAGVIQSENSDKIEMRISTPVFINDVVKGMIVLDFDWELIRDILKERIYGKSGFAFIINERGFVVSHPEYTIMDQVNFSEEKYGELSEIVRNHMLKGKSGQGRYSFKDKDYLIYYVPFEAGQRQYALGATGQEDEFLSMANRIKMDAEIEFKLILKIILISICICIVISSAIGVIVSRSISGPIDKVVNFAQKVSRGDLSETLKSRNKDEIGHLLNAINTMVIAFRKIVCDVKSNGRRLAVSSDEMVTIAGQLAGNSQEMNDQATNVAGTSEMMSDSINTIASRIEEMSMNVLKVSSTTKQMSTNINSMATSIEEMSASMNRVGRNAQMGTQITGQAVQMARKAVETMKLLGKSANEIGGVTKAIKRLAYKTNLLALNASIEAAAAGDAGKGFDVVAKAIQNFAEQSNQAAEDIASRISGVQANASDAVSVISDVSAIIQDINSSSQTILTSVEEQTKAADEIASNALQADERAKAIAFSMDDLAEGANDVSNNVAGVAKGAKGVTASIREVSRAVTDSTVGIRHVNSSAVTLDRLSRDLQKLVSEFKIETESLNGDNKRIENPSPMTLASHEDMVPENLN